MRPGAEPTPPDTGSADGSSSPGEREPVGSLWRGAPEVSKRKRTATREWTYRALAPVISGFLRALWGSYRCETIGEEPWLGPLREGPVIPCFWHGRTVACAGFVRGLTERGLEPCALVSPSLDGDLTSKVIERWGFRVLRGSATRTGPKAIRDLYRVIVKERRSPIVIPDGPQGPAHEAKLGALMLSQVAQVPILPISFATNRSFVVKTWDRWIVPYPFARVAFAMGEPIRVERDATSEDLEQARLRLEEALNTLEARAAEHLAPVRAT